MYPTRTHTTRVRIAAHAQEPDVFKEHLIFFVFIVKMYLQIWTTLGVIFEISYKTFPHQLLRKLYFSNVNMTLNSYLGGIVPC